MSPAARSRRAQEQALEEMNKWQYERDEAEKPPPEPDDEPPPSNTFT